MPSLSSVRNVVLSAVVMFLAFTVAACSAPASQSSTPPPQPTHENTRGVTAYGTDGAVVEWSVVHRDAVSEIPRDMVVSDGHVVPVWGCDRFIVDRGDAGLGCASPWRYLGIGAVKTPPRSRLETSQGSWRKESSEHFLRQCSLWTARHVG